MNKLNYNHTIRACFTGYIVQAIVNNFVPLLFVLFKTQYMLSLSQVAFLVTINFGVQLTVDLLGAFVVDKVGYRVSMIFAHVASALGFVLLTFLPDVMNPYGGIIIAVIVYAIGGGLLEVVVSPVVEACPTENKESVMGLLHSFYCWGHVGVVCISTLFFAICGIENWRWICILWIIVCLANGAMFFKVPLYSLVAEDEENIPIGALVKNKLFWVLLVMMIAAGASEQAVSQWSSAFAEMGLNVDKTIGDLAGPMFFAIMMGTSRAIYSKVILKVKLEKMMLGMAVLCAASYLMISLSPWPVVSLVGCGICGFSVGIMWPGTFSMASSVLRRGGTTLFAFLALGGDIGCGGGPTFVGTISDAWGGILHNGILCAVIFPVLMIAGLLCIKSIKKSDKV